MEQLYVDFTKYIDENVYDTHELYEALPINDKQVSLTSNCTINLILLLGSCLNNILHISCLKCESTIRGNI
jgi:hypothetical protein